MNTCSEDTDFLCFGGACLLYLAQGTGTCRMQAMNHTLLSSLFSSKLVAVCIGYTSPVTEPREVLGRNERTAALFLVPSQTGTCL